MSESDCKSIRDVLGELDQLAPGSPLLALGQTIFWDEPIGSDRKFIAGIHDTDYFAKLPSGKHRKGKFQAFPHNDTTTRGLWSAAGEFSTLFGSETVVTRELYQHAGLRINRLEQERPGFIDEATEAYGWRGIVSLDEAPPVTAEVPLSQIKQVLFSTLDWALDEAIERLCGQAKVAAKELADELRTQLCEIADEPGLTVSEYYQRLVKAVYEFCADARLNLETATTTQLLQFNRATCSLPRFEIVDRFVNHETRSESCRAYDEAIHGSAGLYELARFGTGAIPFDLVIPGVGRGTIRLGNRGAVIMTPKPQFLSYKQPLKSVAELAGLIEDKFGPNCTLVGKAVTLIGMLAREHVFVFHEGASSYVKHSRKLHQLLNFQANPILRIRYDTWSALGVCCSWLNLPEVLQPAYGTEELCAPSFASRWRDVAKEQRELLQSLTTLRRPVQLIEFLEKRFGGSWDCLAKDYVGLQGRLSKLNEQLAALKSDRRAVYAEIKRLKSDRIAAEKAKGDHFREFIFEKEASAEKLVERERLASVLEDVIHRMSEAHVQMKHLSKLQESLVKDPEILRIHERRRSIELEAELKRARMIRSAVVASSGLEASNRRPSAWWFRLVCPDGLWFRETVETAQCYLEPMS